MTLNNDTNYKRNDDKNDAVSWLKFKWVFITAIAGLSVTMLVLGIDELRAYAGYYLFGVWSPILERNIEFSEEPRIAALGDNVYLLWKEKNGSNYDLMFAKSEDNGNSFGDPIRLDDETIEHPQQHQLVLDESGGQIHAIWSALNPRFANGSHAFLYYTRSIDGGNSFEKFRLLTNDTNSAYREYAKIIASDGKFVNIFWSSNSFNLTQARSSDGGATFSDPVYLEKQSSVSEASAREIDVVAAGDYIHLLLSENWYLDDGESDGRVYLRTSVDHGVTFGTPVLIADGGTSFSLATSENGQDVYVAWHNDPEFTAGDVILRTSADGGTTFSPAINASINEIEHSVAPRITASAEGDVIYLTWRDTTPAVFDNNDNVVSPRKHEIKFLKLSETEGEIPHNDAHTLTRQNANGFETMISTGNNNTLHVIWDGFVGPSSEVREPEHDIFYLKSSDGGTSFGFPINLSDTQGNSAQQVMAISGKDVYAAWTEREPGGRLIDSNVFFAASHDEGVTFTEPVLIK